MNDQDNITIHAYIDGELSESESASFEKKLKANPELQTQADSIKLLKSRLKEAYAVDAFAEESSAPIDTNAIELQAHKNTSKKFNSMAMAASLIVGLGIGVLGYKHLQPASVNANTWLAQMANYQAMYTKATLDKASTSTSDIPAQIANWERALGKQLEVPDLTNHGLEFKRGQILKSSDDAPVIQLAYVSSDTGLPVAVCITTPTTKDLEESPRTGELYAQKFVLWEQQNKEIAIMANHISIDTLLAIKDDVSEAMDI